VVVKRYRALGTHIARTDEQGAITIRTDGQSVWVTPFIGEPMVFSAPTTQHLAETFTPSLAAPR
jgi:hypothetical protein